MGTSHNHKSPKVCIKHNRPIFMFDQQQNQELCLTCVQEKTGLVSINQIEQKQQELKLKCDQFDSKSNNTQVQEIKQHKMQNPGLFKYELTEQIMIKECYQCCSFAFNNDNSILIIGNGSDINIYQLIQGKIGEELQKFSNYKAYVNCLYYMKKSDCLVSGGSHNTIIIWKQQRDYQWVQKQILKNHQSSINCLLMNKNEDLLISGSDDETVKFWKQDKDKWNCEQTIKTGNPVYALSLNETENKLISCGYQQYLLVIEISEKKKWSIKQKIDVEEQGNRLCFTLGDQFVFQPRTMDYLEVYDYSGSSNLYIQQSKVQIQDCERCYLFFPCQFVRSLNILLVKHGQFVNVFKVDNGNYQLIQTIQYNCLRFFGKVSDDGQYLVTWDEEFYEIKVRKLSQIND